MIKIILMAAPVSDIKKKNSLSLSLTWVSVDGRNPNFLKNLSCLGLQSPKEKVPVCLINLLAV